MEIVPMEKWRSVTEIADYLGVSKESIHRWIKRTDIPAHRIGKLWKFKAYQVDEWVMRGNAGKIKKEGRDAK